MAFKMTWKWQSYRNELSFSGHFKGHHTENENFKNKISKPSSKNKISKLFFVPLAFLFISFPSCGGTPCRPPELAFRSLTPGLNVRAISASSGRVFRRAVIMPMLWSPYAKLALRRHLGGVLSSCTPRSHMWPEWAKIPQNTLGLVGVSREISKNKISNNFQKVLALSVFNIFWWSNG